MNTDRADTGLGGFLLGMTTGDWQGEGKKELNIESGAKYGKQKRTIKYRMLEVHYIAETEAESALVMVGIEDLIFDYK